MDGFNGKWKSKFSDIQGFENWMDFYGVDDIKKDMLRGKPWIFSYTLEENSYLLGFQPKTDSERGWSTMNFGETYDSFDVFGFPIKICMTYSDGVLMENTTTEDGKTIVVERRINDGKLEMIMKGIDKEGKSAVMTFVMSRC